METAYEAIFIVDTNLAEEQFKAIVDKYTGVITRTGGVVDDVDRWEPRRLAYEIKGRREGQHIVVNFHSEPASRDELDRIFRISDDNLRHLIVKQDKAADRFPSRVRAAEYERRERDMAARAAAAPPPPAPAPQPVTDLAASEDTEGVESAAGVSDNTANVNEPPLPDATPNTLAGSEGEATTPEGGDTDETEATPENA